MDQQSALSRVMRMNRILPLWGLLALGFAQAPIQPLPSDGISVVWGRYRVTSAQLEAVGWDVREGLQELESPHGVEGKPERISHLKLGLAGMVLLIGGAIVRLGRSAPPH